MKSLVRFLVQFSTAYVAFTAEVISLSANMAGYLTLHWIVGWSRISRYFKADIFLPLNIKDLHRILMRRSEEHVNIMKRTYEQHILTQL